MATKRQTTMAKLQRERRVQEKRERKLEKKQAAAAAKALGEQPPVDPDAPVDLNQRFDGPVG
jgi:hypothetical protein